MLFVSYACFVCSFQLFFFFVLLEFLHMLVYSRGPCLTPTLDFSLPDTSIVPLSLRNFICWCASCLLGSRATPDRCRLVQRRRSIRVADASGHPFFFFFYFLSIRELSVSCPLFSKNETALAREAACPFSLSLSLSISCVRILRALTVHC